MDYLTLFISLRCTNSCPHCLYGCSPKHGEDMSPAVFKQAIDTAKANEIHTINFFGGEPLVNPDFFSMMQTVLEKEFFLILATNCRPLADEEYFTKFLEVTKQHKERIRIVTSRDRFHLPYFDPLEIVIRLQVEGYSVLVNYYADHSILISESNAHNQELQKMDTRFSCCAGGWSDALGVLPDGSWAICPTSLEHFGNIFSNKMNEIIEFKKKLTLRCKDGCTVCLKDFKEFRREFEKCQATHPF